MSILPTGACDCHTHVIGEQAAWPMVADRQYTPGPASAAALQAHLDGLGLQRVVIVQPSVYGTDNGCLLEALAAFEGRARGVAVVDESIDDAGLQALHLAGVRGLRINHESSGRSDADGLVATLQRWAGRLQGLPWHLQVYAGLDTLARAAVRLEALAVPLVLDHFAMAPATTPAGDPRMAQLLALLRTGTTYLKLSAAYRIAGTPGEVQALARLFVETRPDRMLWASDWPHTNREPGKRPLQASSFRTVPVAELAGQLDGWMPEPEVRQQLLSENPARLYDFSGAESPPGQGRSNAPPSQPAVRQALSPRPRP